MDLKFTTAERYQRYAVSVDVDGKKMVYCYDEGELQKKIDVSEYSHYFIRDCIENWNDGIIKND